MKRFLDALLTAFALILIIPTALILISWDAIPGDRFYPLKSGLENATLLIFAGTPLVTEVSVKFTDRRFTEATKLLAKKGSTVGYDLLVAEATQTQNYISEKNDNLSGQKFVQNIETYQKEIEKKKEEVSATIASGSSKTQTPPPTTNTQLNTATDKTITIKTTQNTTNVVTGQTVVVSVPKVVQIVEEEPSAVLQKLEETQQQLEKIKKEVESEQEKRGEGKVDKGNFNKGSDGSQDASNEKLYEKK